MQTFTSKNEPIFLRQKRRDPEVVDFTSAGGKAFTLFVKNAQCVRGQGAESFFHHLPHPLHMHRTHTRTLALTHTRLVGVSQPMSPLVTLPLSITARRVWMCCLRYMQPVDLYSGVIAPYYGTSLIHTETVIPRSAQVLHDTNTGEARPFVVIHPQSWYPALCGAMQE